MLLQDKNLLETQDHCSTKPFLTKTEVDSNALISVSIGIVFKFVLSDFQSSATDCWSASISLLKNFVTGEPWEPVSKLEDTDKASDLKSFHLKLLLQFKQWK
jgi:hypothetical protein